MPKRVPPPIPSQIVADGHQACIESVFKERIILKYIHLYTISSGGRFQEFAVANGANCKKKLTAKDAKGMRGVFNHETHEKNEREKDEREDQRMQPRICANELTMNL